MAKNNKKKAKWLEESTTPELLTMLTEILADDEGDLKKALKIVDEITARQPAISDTPLSVEEALQAAQATLTAALEGIGSAYENELSMMDESEDKESEEDEDEEEEEAPKSKKSKGGKAKAKDDKPKKGKKAQEGDDEEEEEEEESDEDDSDDYSDWSLKDLKKECRDRGIKVTKSMGKADLVKALEADDKD